MEHIEDRRLQPIKHETHDSEFARTKPFLFSGKALDFISAMLSIIVFISILGESLYTFSDKGAVVWSVLVALSLCVVVLLGLVMFYLYYGFKGLPVPRELDKSISFRRPDSNLLTLLSFYLYFLWMPQFLDTCFISI